ncbi:MAG: SapC family protein [Hyphomonadaceae bacterium]
MSAQGGRTDPEVSGNVLFYRQPEALSLEKHRNLGCLQIERPFRFLVGTHVVPITVNEFGVAAGSYPVIFAGEQKTPLAVMGARPGENVFISPDGEIDPEVYMPAFVRRYPFVFATDQENQRLLVCIDRAAPMIGENPDVPFFIGDEPSEYTQNAIEFCREFEGHRMATDTFIKTMIEMDLFEEKQVAINSRDDKGVETPVKVADYFAISEEKLGAMPPEAWLRLRDLNMLGAIYAHLISLLKWPKVIQRALMIAQAQQNGMTPLS